VGWEVLKNCKIFLQTSTARTLAHIPPKGVPTRTCTCIDPMTRTWAANGLGRPVASAAMSPAAVAVVVKWFRARRRNRWGCRVRRTGGTKLMPLLTAWGTNTALEIRGVDTSYDLFRDNLISYCVTHRVSMNFWK